MHIMPANYVVVLTLLFALFKFSHSLHVLTLGDEFDASAANDGLCASLESKLSIPWLAPLSTDQLLDDDQNHITPQSSHQRVDMGEGKMCVSIHRRSIMSYMNINGLATVIRIESALNKYISKFSAPDLIIVDTSSFDNSAVFMSYLDCIWWRKPFADYPQLTPVAIHGVETSIHAYLDDIGSVLKKVCKINGCHGVKDASSITLGLRSAVHWPRMTKLNSSNDLSFAAPIVSDSKNKDKAGCCQDNRFKLLYEDSIAMQRSIAENRSLAFFDFNHDLWSSYDHSNDYDDPLKDSTGARLVTQYAMKILGLRYSNDYMIPPTLARPMPPLLVDEVGERAGNGFRHYEGMQVRRIMLVQPPPVATSATAPANQTYTDSSSNNSELLYFVSYQLVTLPHLAAGNKAGNGRIRSGHGFRRRKLSKQEPNHQKRLVLYRHPDIDRKMLSSYHLGSADIYTPRSMEEWQQLKEGEPLPSWLAQGALRGESYLVHCVDSVFCNHHGVEWWLLTIANMTRRPLQFHVHNARGIAILLHATLIDDIEQVRWDYLELFTPGKPVPNNVLRANGKSSSF